ncbi:hypothetical protein JJB75_07925 [Clostridium perfringens]|uniref:hypothetical protein n=1 Tax=Clostridium TaxID=1485 RepID=UPI001ABB5BA1|nr:MULTISPECIES: hypothetical protein [Clostridium]MBO3303253.1 hypothetical protein [Clostridium perfringens]MBO3306579.1 hypothetical protein [Clostridium perfringens]MBO3309721.1 hypothetical protein [Clostridium perfringens]MBO3316070.1 hypothetical protein [Clostridium perfringens]MBO3391182.1 hypothetical protein [Clostridium perfringens]
MLPKLALSITSFIPLYSLMIFMYIYQFLYGTMDSNTKRYVIIAVAIIVIVQVFFSMIASRYIKEKESSQNTENEIVFKNINEDKKAEINYMMTYLLPLLTFDLDKISGFYIFYTNILILVFIFMNARAENFSFNIFLWIKGYYIYKGNNINGDEKVLLIKKRKFSNIRSNNEKYKFVSFGGSNDIYLCKKYN